MATTHFPLGVTNVPQASATGTLLFPDPSRCHTFYDDFDKFDGGYAAATDPAVAVPGDWLVTQITGTTATATVGDVDGGVVALTNDSTAAHGVAVQWLGKQASVVESFSWDSSLPMWFKTRFKVSDAINSALVMGLQITDTTPFSVSDGLYFSKADTSTSVAFNAIKTGAGTTTLSSIATLADDTYIELAFSYLPYGDDLGSPMPILLVYANGNKVGSITTFTNVPTRTLTISAALQNGAAGASTVLSWDYVLMSKARAQTSLTS